MSIEHYKSNCAKCYRRSKWWYWTLITIECIVIIVGTSYIVFWLDYSGWWFLFAIILCENSHNHEE